MSPLVIPKVVDEINEERKGENNLEEIAPLSSKEGM
jgi:hypothetical protein